MPVRGPGPQRHFLGCRRTLSLLLHASRKCDESEWEQKPVSGSLGRDHPIPGQTDGWTQASEACV